MSRWTKVLLLDVVVNFESERMIEAKHGEMI